MHDDARNRQDLQRRTVVQCRTGPRQLRPRTLTIVAAVTFALLLLTTGCTTETDQLTSPQRPAKVGTIELVRAQDCTRLAEAVHERQAAIKRFEERMPVPSMSDEGMGVQSTVPSSAAVAAPADQSAGADRPSPVPPSSAGNVVAGTNIQEGGVDEGDMVKTDGAHMYVLSADGTFRVVELGDQPRVLGTVSIAKPTGLGRGQMFLRGDEAVTAVPTGSGVGLSRIDVSQPASPKVVEQVSVLGDLVATRMTKGAAPEPMIRIVMRTGASTYDEHPDPIVEPGIPRPPVTVVNPTIPPDPTTTTPQVGTTSTQAPIDETTTAVEQVLPHRIDDKGTQRTIGDCSDVFVEPMTASGSSGSDDSSLSPAPSSSGVTILTIRDSLTDLSPVTVLGGAEEVYASPDALYAAASIDSGGASATAVHRFDLRTDGAAHYTGSGLVAGRIEDQYSMSERNGALRIVTTATRTTPSAEDDVTSGFGCFERDGGTICVDPGPDAVARTSQAGGPAGRLAVLRPDQSGTLREVGHLDDIGAGEEVKSVRFLDDRAYVVTFRQTDPLFAVDLSNDAAPKLLGEVKLPGFSEYLHPVGDGRLLGIGVDADPRTGRTNGFKATLFDVEDPTAPKVLDSFKEPKSCIATSCTATSPVGQDPHGFTWDQVRHQAVVPVETSFQDACYNVPAPCDSTDSKADVIAVDGDHLVLRGEIAHDVAGSSASILRSVVVDSTIWTVSARGVGRTDAANPTSVSFLPF